MVNVTVPSLSASTIVFVTVQSVLSFPATAVYAASLMVTSGISIGSEEVKLSMTVLPVVALDESFELSDSMDTAVSVGFA